MALRDINKIYPKIDGGVASKFGFSKLTFIKTDTEPPDYVEGTVYFDDSEETLKLRTASAWVALGAGTTSSTGLDGAYDINKTITVDGATITLAGTAPDVLTITNSADKECINITKTGSGAGYPIQIQNSGTGEDIYGTSGTWKVSKAGAATFTTIAGTDITVTGTQTITTDDTSGVAINIEADSLTTGTALEIDSNTGAAVTLLDLQNAGTSVMTVGGTGIVTLAGVAKDADAIVITDGDITLTDGDLDLTSGQFTMATDGAGDGMALTDLDGNNYDLLYLNGSTQTGSGHILSIAQGAATRTGHAIDIAMGTTAVAMSAIDISCTGGTRTTPIIAIDSDGTASDFIEMQNSVIFTGNFIEMIQDTSAATGNFIFINNDSGTSMEAINIDDETNTVDIIKVDSAGVLGAGKAQISLTQSAGAVNATANAILVDWTADVDANTPIMVKLDSHGRDINAMTIDSDAVTDVVLIHGGGALTNGEAVLALTNDGNLAAGGNLLSVDMGGTPADETVCAVEITAAKDCQALAIATSAATASGIVFTGSGATANDTAVFEVNWGASTPANAGSNLVRLDASGATNTVKPVILEIYDDSVAVGLAIETATIEDMVTLNATGDTGNDKSVLDITWGAVTPNVGGNLLRLDATAATTTSKPVILEILDDSVAVGLTVTTASVEDMITFTGAGATGAGKAVLAITSTGTIADGGYYVDITSGANGASSTASALLHLDATHDYIEALHVDSGTVKIDESLGIGNWTVDAATVTSDGSGTGTIPDDVNCCQLTSTNTDHWAILPAPTPGKEVWIIGDATSACELRSSTEDAVSINNVVGTGCELTILADTTYHALCINATNWIVSKWDNVGAVAGGGTPN